MSDMMKWWCCRRDELKFTFRSSVPCREELFSDLESGKGKNHAKRVSIGEASSFKFRAFYHHAFLSLNLKNRQAKVLDDVGSCW
jgi:hypothetical protein